MNKRYTVSIMAWLLPAIGMLAQEGQYRYADDTQLWRLTDNAAALSLDSSQNRGVATINGEHREGDYHRVQEGGMRNGLQFYTERYQKINQILVGYGSFSFDMDRTKDRAWCDVMRPYDSNPYFGGSSLSGKYDRQDFDFTAQVGTIQLWGVTAGIRLDYEVGDLSRIRDPRSRSKLLDYRLTPSLTYTWGSNTLGVSGHYNRRKEQMPALTTVQTDPNLMYYNMYGMEHITGAVGSYATFAREWVNHAFGTRLSYGYHNGRLNSVSTVGISRGSEDIYEKEKKEPGHFTQYEYLLDSYNRLRTGRLLHMMDVKVAWRQAYGDEYRQQRIQTNDPETGLASYHHETLIAYDKRYQVETLLTALHYRCDVVGDKTVNAYVGAKADYDYALNKHLLPESQLKHSAIDFTLEGGHALLGQRLWVDAEAGCHLSTKADIQLADATTDYAVQVLMPDMAYYEADYWRGRLAITYQFPLTIKGTRSEWFVKAYGDYLKTNNALHSATIGATIGIYY